MDEVNTQGGYAVEQKSNAFGDLFQRKPIEKGLEAEDVSDRDKPQAFPLFRFRGLSGSVTSRPCFSGGEVH
jgi:hypothetical protein